jgi:hypothetical protein
LTDERADGYDTLEKKSGKLQLGFLKVVTTLYTFGVTIAVGDLVNRHCARERG